MLPRCVTGLTLTRRLSTTAAVGIDPKYDLGGLSQSGRGKARKPRGPPKDWSAIRPPRAIPRQSEGRVRHPEASHRPRQHTPRRSTSATKSSLEAQAKATAETAQDDAELPISDEVENESKRPSGKRTLKHKAQTEERGKAFWKNVQKQKSIQDSMHAKKVHGRQPKAKQVKQKRVSHKLDIPSLVPVSNLARLLNVRLSMFLTFKFKL